MECGTSNETENFSCSSWWMRSAFRWLFELRKSRREADPNFRPDSTSGPCAKRSRPRVGFVFHCPLISGH